MIQLANTSHLENILQIEEMVFTQPWTRNQLKKDLTLTNNAENWVYKEGHQIVGYILGWKVMDEFHLNNIAVHPEYLRRSIGKELIRHIISRISYYIKVILLEVSANNIPANKCYKSLGFTQRGIRKDYYSKGDDAILYYLDLIKNG